MIFMIIENFWKYAKDYGYEQTDTPGPGSFLQFTRDPTKKEYRNVKRDLGKDYADQLKEYGYPYHIGIMDSDSTYINDGYVDENVFVNTLIDSEGKRKRYHAYDRIVEKKEMGGPAEEVINTETVTEQVTPQAVTENITETQVIEEAPKPKKPLTPLMKKKQKSLAFGEKPGA